MYYDVSLMCGYMIGAMMLHILLSASLMSRVRRFLHLLALMSLVNRRLLPMTFCVVLGQCIAFLSAHEP